jgi:succinate dehydrogenase/fumarate reductase cytochrome b subunit
MRRQDRSPVVTLLILVVLAAVAWLGGGAVRIGLLALGNGQDFASDVGALSAAALFGLLLVGYLLYDFIPRNERPGRFG